MHGDFYFSYRHYQALSNELVTPKLVACPADTRRPAANFVVFNNDNLSYFVAVNADFSRPDSLLAGDRNLTNDFQAPSALAELGPGSSLRWTAELHRFKGNLLFSDGHVQEKTSAGLLAMAGGLPLTAQLGLPFPRPSGEETHLPTDTLPTGKEAASKPLVADGSSAERNIIPIVLTPIGLGLRFLELSNTGEPAKRLTTMEATGIPNQSPRAATQPGPAAVETNQPALDAQPVASLVVWMGYGSWWLYLLLLILALAVILRSQNRRSHRRPSGSDDEG